MTSRTETRPPKAQRLRGVAHSDAFAVAAAALVAWGFGLLVLNPPDVVPTVTVENTSNYNIGVKVSGPDGAWMGLGTAAKQSTAVIHEVIDQGDEWVFHFSSQGRQAGEFRIDRADLAQAQWRIQIPADVSQTLRDSGAQLPP